MLPGQDYFKKNGEWKESWIEKYGKE